MKYNLANNEPLEINGDIYVKGVGTYDGTNAGESGVKTLKDILNSGVTEITWSDLVDLRNNNELIPGQYYRITDYTCTTAQKGTKSAGHVFDIIVRADSENKLNEEASAIQHTGDEYFADCDLNAWKLWYCLDNDTTRFAWADGTNGKGVIYRMIDEFGNDVPYDFKNIQFYRKWNSSKSLWSDISSDSTGVPCYTFSSKGDSSTTSFTDMSLVASNRVYSNVIKEYIDSNKQTLNNNCFFGNNNHFNTFESNCDSNSFGNGCSSNSFGTVCYKNTFGSSCWSNTFGYGCHSNTFGNSFSTNIFGNNCRLNTFRDECYSNTFGNSCESNTFETICFKNTFGNDCYSNTFGTNFYFNTFGNNCSSNSFGNSCEFNTFGNGCYSNTFGKDCESNTFENDCDSNTFGNNCQNNTFGNNCQNNSFGNNCQNNSFGSSCSFNTFWNDCSYNSFGNICQSNSFDNSCQSNSFDNSCQSNYFGRYCSCNSFRNNCDFNSFGNNCDTNSFGNGCKFNSFRISADKASALKNYVYYNHFDDGCSYNVIWNSDTTSSSILLKNINVNRGVVGTSSSYNMINIDVLNSEQEINVNQVGGSVSIEIKDIILSITYESLKTLRDSSKLIPGQQYRIIDYITGTSQENTQSAGHQFDIIVTALDEHTLSEEAQAIQNINDSYFDSSNLSAWKLWYCLDNDTNRFAWAGDVKVGEIEHKKYDSSKCTINPELINGNAFKTPFNFESCVWVDGNSDGLAYSDDHIHHDISELIYEWGYFTDENGVKQLCIYKSDADLYAEEGHPDYGDKYLYRGVVNVDGTDYDYWQKWDVWPDGSGSINVGGGDDYVYATTQRIVSNPEAYSATIEIENIYQPGKGVIYRMIDEWNNDVAYDFKNIQYNGSWGYWAYTFNWINDGGDNSCEDLSVAQYAHTNDEGGYSHTYGNIIKPCEFGKEINYGVPFNLNACVFLSTESYDSGCYYGCDCNTFGNGCYNNIFREGGHNNSFGEECYDNTFENNCSYNSFGDSCCNNSFGNDCHENAFGNDCHDNAFGAGCLFNSFGCSCGNNTFGNNCQNNTFGVNNGGNTFGDSCYCNSLGNSNGGNAFGTGCSFNSFGNYCIYIKFASDKLDTTKYNYYQNNHFGDGCKYILFKGAETASSSQQVQNYNFAQGLQGTDSEYLTIEGVRNLSYEVKVAKNSKGEIKIYCEADLIA